MDEQHAVALCQRVPEHQATRPGLVVVGHLDHIALAGKSHPVPVTGARRRKHGGTAQHQGKEERAHGRGLSAYIGSAPTLRERRCAVKRNELHPAPSQIRSGAAQCAPRQAAAGTAGNREAGKNEKPLHRVLTFFETALRCAAPLTETASGPRRQGRLESTPHRVLTKAKVALRWAARFGQTVTGRQLRSTLKEAPSGC